MFQKKLSSAFLYFSVFNDYYVDCHELYQRQILLDFSNLLQNFLVFFEIRVLSNCCDVLFFGGMLPEFCLWHMWKNINFSHGCEILNKIISATTNIHWCKHSNLKIYSWLIEFFTRIVKTNTFLPWSVKKVMVSGKKFLSWRLFCLLPRCSYEIHSPKVLHFNQSSLPCTGNQIYFFINLIVAVSYSLWYCS